LAWIHLLLIPPKLDAGTGRMVATLTLCVTESPSVSAQSRDTSRAGMTRDSGGLQTERGDWMNDTQSERTEGTMARLWQHAVLVIIAGGSLVADQVTKRLAANHLAEQAYNVFETQRFAGRFSLAHNPAGAWSLFGWAPGTPRRIMFVTVSILASVMLVVWYARTQSSQRLLRLGISFVLGGALGNLVDRALAGHVIDFVEVSAMWGGSRHFWPTFNVADIVICVGVGLMAIDMFRAPKSAPAA
jgi:lipoprotein signal peptidase